MCVLIILVVILSLWSVNNVVLGVDDVVVVVDGRKAIGVSDDNFICATLDWWPPEKCDYGTCSWGHASLLNLDLTNPILLNAVKAFSPLKIRLGGTLQDKVTYGIEDPKKSCPSFVKNSTEMFGFSPGCLPIRRWNELNEFFQKSEAFIIFGLNALSGRAPQADGSVVGSWDSTNAESLIRYSVNMGYDIGGWELGNELSGSGIGGSIGADQYAADMMKLRSIVDDIYRGFPTKPLVMGPGGFFDANWFSGLISGTKPDYIDVVTHHIYNLGAGVDDHLVERILDPSYLDGEAATFRDLREILQSGGSSASAWVGEAGGAYNSGHHLVTDSFVFSFWYLDQLGMSSNYDTKSYCRQTLIGGNYGLLNTTTFHPNPDYYSALLWNRLMGRFALSTTITGTGMLRGYAHCARESQGITLLLINLSGNTTSQVYVNTKANYPMGNGGKARAQRTTFRHKSVYRKGEFSRNEYHLTPKDGDIHSQTMLLNDNILCLDEDGNIPKIKPIEVEASKPIVVEPFSIVFAHIPYFYARICR